MDLTIHQCNKTGINYPVIKHNGFALKKTLAGEFGVHKEDKINETPLFQDKCMRQALAWMYIKTQTNQIANSKVGFG